MTVDFYCQHCEKHTKHIPVVDSYAYQCLKCLNLTSGLDQADTESNKFYTPQGSEGMLVRNDKDKVIFSIEEGTEAGYYVYDKRSGFGGVQKR